MNTTRDHASEQRVDAAAAATVDELQTIVATKLRELRDDWYPMLDALLRATQQHLSFQTPETQHAIAELEAHEAELDRREHLRYSRAGQQWRRPEQRLVGGGHTRTPVQTFSALWLLEETTWILHDIIRRTIRALSARGVCVIARLPVDPTTVQLLNHVRDLTWAAPSPTLLTDIDRNLTWLIDHADRLVNGDSKSTLPDPCPWCQHDTLVVYFRDDVIICGRNTRTRHLEPCICTDPVCDCKQDPLTHRHTWIRNPPSARNSWHNLSGQLAVHRRAAHTKEKPMPHHTDQEDAMTAQLQTIRRGRQRAL